MTEIEKALVAALNEQRLVIEALEQRIVALEGQERFALTEVSNGPQSCPPIGVQC